MFGVKQAYERAKTAMCSSYGTLDELSLWKEFMRTKNQALVNYFTCKYMPLALKMTKYFSSIYQKSRLISRDDIEVIAGESLVELINKYNNLKVKFSTFAYSQLCNRIRDHLKEEMEISMHYNQKSKKIREFTDHHYLKNGSMPSQEEVMKNVGFNHDEMARLRNYEGIKNLIPLEGISRGREGSAFSVEDIIVDDRVDIVGGLIEIQKIELLHYTIQRLKSEKQKEIIMMHYFNEMPNSDIAKRLNISKSAVTKRLQYAEGMMGRLAEPFRSLFLH